MVHGQAGRATVTVVVGLALVAAAFLVGAASVDGPLGDLLGTGQRVETGPAVVTGIRSLRELTTVEAVEFTTLTAEDDRGVLDFALGDELRLLAVARVRAGVDLAQVGPGDVEVDDETSAVRVTLPPATIQSVALDNEATQVYDRDTGLLTDGDDQLETRARQQAEEVLREQALDAGLIEKAEEEAVAAIEDLLGALGYDRVEVTVDR